MSLEIGTKVGRWTILEETRKEGKKHYRCRCDCGNVREVYYSTLEKGKSQSCGCLRAELIRARAENLTGKRFGRLLVIGPDEEKHGYWVCQCDCGETTSVRAKSLKLEQGGTRSCGCIQREFAVEQGAKSIKENSIKQVERNIALNTNIQIISSQKPYINNKSGHKGVWWDKKRQEWEAFIRIHGKRKYLGRYKNFEDAVKARKRAEEQYFDPILEKMSLK